MRTDELLRVLLVVHELFPGAPSVPVDALEWMRSRVEVQTVALGGGFLEGRYRRLGKLNIVPAWEAPLHRRIQRRWMLWRLRRDLARFQPQLIYVNSIVSLGPARRLGLPDVPVLVHIHELESHVEPVLAASGDLVRSWPNRYVAVSEAVRELLTKVVGIPEGKVSLVHDFIHDDVLSHSTRRRGPAADEKGKLFVVGGSGHPSWRKGITLWLQMAVAVRRLLPGMALQFRWVGMVDNEQARGARLEARKLGIEDVVKFIPRTEKPLDEFREFDVFAMTSWEDPCPLVVLQNMALGKAVLCFAGGGGAAEEVGDSGVIVPGFNPEMMAAAVAELAGDSSRREALGSAARTRVERMFVASVQAPKLLEEMKRTAATKGKAL